MTLISFFCYCNTITIVTLVSTKENSESIDIADTCEKYSAIITDILAAHALSGCDTTAKYQGIGKVTGYKVLTSLHCSLSLLGKIDANFQDVFDQCSNFIAECYGFKKFEGRVSELRYNVWKKKISLARTSAPLLETLPPTVEALKENVLTFFKSLLI